MKNLKTYEGFWNFGKKKILEPKESNKLKIEQIPQFLKNSGIAKNLLGMQIVSYEVGISKMYSDRLVVDINTKNYGNFFRFHFLINDENLIVKPLNCLCVLDSIVQMNSDKPFAEQEDQIHELLMIRDKIFDYMKEIGLVI